MSNFILASKSPRRGHLLTTMGVEFVAVDPGVDEDDSDVRDLYLPMKLAKLKAEAVAERFPESVVVGADTMIDFKGWMMGKPRDIKEAEEILMRLSGETHAVVTGVCLRRRTDHLLCMFSVRTLVTFKKLSQGLIAEYLRMIDPLDKAGAYAAQVGGDILIEEIDGSLNNVIGLPTERLAVSLRAIECLAIPTRRMD